MKCEVSSLNRARRSQTTPGPSSRLTPHAARLCTWIALLCLGLGCEAVPGKKGPAQAGDEAQADGAPIRAADKKEEIRDDAEALFCAGYEAMLSRDYKTAVEHFEKSLEKSAEIGQDPPEVHEALIEAYQLMDVSQGEERRATQGRHTDKVMEHIEKLTKLVPNNFLYHAQLGLFYSGQDGKAREAVAEMEKAAECPPPAMDVWRKFRLKQADMYRQAREPRKAMKVLDDLAKQKLPADEQYELNREFAMCWLDLREEDTEAYAKAIPFLEKCLMADHAGRNPYTASICWQLGFCYAFAEKPGPAKAIQKASQLLLRLPRSHELRFWLAILYKKQKDNKRAAQLLQEIIDGKYARPREDPLLQSYLELAQISIQEKDYKKAAAVLQRGVAEIPQRSIQSPIARQLRLRLVSTYSAMGEDAKVIDELVKILAADPEFPAACNFLGYLYADKGIKLDEALTLIERALKLDREDKIERGEKDPPDSAAYVDSLAWAYYKLASADDKQDRLTLAREKLNESLELMKKEAEGHGEDFSDDPVVRDHVGDVCFCLGLWEEARDAWQKSLKLCEKMSDRTPDLLPDTKYLKKKLDRIERLLEAESQQQNNKPSP